MGLDPADVPIELRYLLPLAERWGIGDDTERWMAVHDATPDERRDLRLSRERPTHCGHG